MTLKTSKAIVQRVDPIVMDRGASLRARILLPSGRAAAGALVHVSSNPRQDYLEDVPLTAVSDAVVGRADETGVVHIDRLPYTPTFIEVAHPGTGGAKVSRSLSRSPGAASDIQLRPGTRVSGRVVDERDRPLADAAVHVLVDERDPQHHENVAYDHHELVTDADGRFAIDDIPPKPVLVVVRAPSYPALRTAVVGREGMVIRMTPIDAELRDRRLVIEKELGELRRNIRGGGSAATQATEKRVEALEHELGEITEAENKAAAASGDGAACGGGGQACG